MAKAFRIAVADDEPDMQAYFRRVLPRLGHEVVSVAGTGTELVEHCRTHCPDLVITDIRMPELDGIEAARIIAERQQMPFILVSAFHDMSLIERAQSAYIMAYLVKPIKQADLSPAIALAMRMFYQLQPTAKKPLQQHENSAPPPAVDGGRQLVQRAERRLQESYPSLRNLRCSWNDGVVTIHGDVSSYYLKQMAQALVRQIDNKLQIENRVHVVENAGGASIDRARPTPPAPPAGPDRHCHRKG